MGSSFRTSFSKTGRKLRREIFKLSTIAKALVLGSVVTWQLHRPGSALEVIERWLKSLPGLRAAPKEVVRAALAGASGIVTLAVGNISSTYLLRALLTYKGAIFHRKPTLFDKVWGVVVTALERPFGTPGTFALQSSMPHLPVPALRDTVRKYLKSVVPLLSSDDYERIERAANQFLVKDGPKLQILLTLRSWLATNWLEEWWEKYVYLRGRAPIMINSNFYTFDSDYSLQGFDQAERCASLLFHLTAFRTMIDREEIAPVMADPYPLCMAGFERLFGTTR